MHLITSFNTVFGKYFTLGGVAGNGAERKYCTRYCENISLTEGVAVWKYQFMIFHFKRVLWSWKQNIVILLECLSFLA